MSTTTWSDGSLPMGARYRQHTTRAFAHHTRSGVEKLVSVAEPSGPQSMVTFVTNAPTRAAVRAAPAAALAPPARNRNVLGVVPGKVVSPASTTTEAEPSGHRERIEPWREGSSSELTVCPCGTAPSSG